MPAFGYIGTRGVEREEFSMSVKLAAVLVLSVLALVPKAQAAESDPAGLPDRRCDALKPLRQTPAPVLLLRPVYPKHAWEELLDGSATFSFTITRDGRTRTVSLVDSTDPVFDRPARRVVDALRFRPGATAGERACMQWRVDFRRSGAIRDLGDSGFVSAQCPQGHQFDGEDARILVRVPPRFRVLRREIEGEVVLQHTVTADGRVEDVYVFHSSMGREYRSRPLLRTLEAAAVDAVRRWRYRPATRDGEPVDRPCMVVIIQYEGRGNTIQEDLKQQ